MSVKKIIQQVKSHPELWLTSHRRYKDKLARELAWRDIATVMGKDHIMIRKRWKNLKDAFRKELKRILIKEITTSTWHYFDELAFITEEILLGIGKKDNNLPTNDNTNEIQAPNPNDPLSIKIEYSDAEPSTSTDANVDLDSNSHPNPNTRKSSAKRKAKRTRKQSSDNIRVPLDSEQMGDADYMFLVSLLPTIRTLTDVQKLQFRCTVNKWLLDTVSQELDNVYNNSKAVDSDDSFER